MDHLTPDPARYGVPYWIDDFNGMPYRHVGDSGLRASAIGLGAWKFGHPATGDGARVDQPTAFSIFDRAIELGVTFWDTANRYNDASGNSERVIGAWLRANPDQRRNIVLATKLCGGMDGFTPGHAGLSRSNIIASLDASLARLQLDYVDLLYFHRFDPAVPVAESLEAIEDLVRAGKIRYFAVSQFGTEQLDTYLSTASELSRRCRPVAVQNQYDPIGREPDQSPGVLDYCARNGLSYVPYCPLARGLLTSRYLDRARVGTGDRLYDENLLSDIATPERLDKVRRLGELADEWGHEISQLALAYLLSLPGMGPQIPGCSSVAQLESNAAAGAIELDSDQRAALAKALA